MECVESVNPSSTADALWEERDVDENNVTVTKTVYASIRDASSISSELFTIKGQQLHNFQLIREWIFSEGKQTKRTLMAILYSNLCLKLDDGNVGAVEKDRLFSSHSFI